MTAPSACWVGVAVPGSLTFPPIMVAVFSIFATLSIFEFKVFGAGMAAMLIDATVVRGVHLDKVLAPHA